MLRKTGRDNLYKNVIIAQQNFVRLLFVNSKSTGPFEQKR